MIILDIQLLLHEILFQLFNNKTSFIKINLISIVLLHESLNKKMKNELICKKIPKYNEDIQYNIIKTYYNIINKEIREKQKRIKSQCLTEIDNRKEYYYFKKDIFINNKFYCDLLNFSYEYIHNSKYNFIIDGNYIIGIKNLDENKITTLSQFIYFGKILEKFLTNQIKNFVIYPNEIVKIFRRTHLSSFRSLYLLYEARNDFFKKHNGQKVNYKYYIEFMINYMNKSGHSVNVVRNGQNNIVFLHL
jgi:hypothetical protein